jgi:hypothetical protein
VSAHRDLIQLERHEAKYIIPAEVLPRMREYLRPFCLPDAYGKGVPPEYAIVTLQLDSPALTLHHAKEWEALNRFKLRVRTYETPGCPVFLEVKRKVGAVVIKSRAAVPAARWSADLIHQTYFDLTFKSDREYVAFLAFIRLARELDARPVVRLRYVRESYFGVAESYARVSFDRCLQYQPANTWALHEPGAPWLTMDTDLTQNKLLPFSGVVLELKTTAEVPRWMVELTREFDLERTGNCKYSTAVWSEAVFRGSPAAPAYVSDLMAF